ncbi:unnamed protein product [Alopecurus aequalis]
MENNAFYFMLALALPPLLYIIRFYYLASSRFRSRSLRLPPGPWQLPVIGSLHHLFGALPHRALRDLSRRHGPLMLFKLGANPVIVVSTAEASTEIMKTHDTTFCTRPLSPALNAISKHGLGIVFAPYGDHWRQLRKICFLELLSAKRIASFSSIRGEETARFIRSISAASESEPLVNLSEMLAAYLTDTTVHMIMGGQFTEQETLLHHVDEAVGIVSCVTLPDLFPSSKLAHALSTTLRRAEVFREAFLALMGRAIDDHLESKKTASSEQVHQEHIVDVLLRVQGEGNLQPPLTMNNIKAVLFDLFAGGTETTLTTLQWAMAELMRNPSMMSRAQDEVRAAFMGQNKVTEEGLGELSYLQCIIKETLRLHPPGPLVPRECREHCRILGYDVPKGTAILVNVWAINRDPQCWDEPEEFVPERFVASDKDFKGNNFDFIPFGAGRRICPGMLFGLATIELALASLLFNFDWSLPDGTLPSELDMTETMGVAARKKVPLWLRPTPHVF